MERGVYKNAAIDASYQLCSFSNCLW